MNKLYLRSFSDINNILELNSLEEVESKDAKIKGFYSFIKDKISALYVENNKLLFKYNDQIELIDDNVRAEIEQIGKEFRFILLSANKILLEFIYSVDSDELGNEPPFSFIENEHFNWGLFLKNIINNKKRKNNIIEYYS